MAKPKKRRSKPIAFIVTLTREVTQTAEIGITARSPHEAKKLAEARADGPLIWLNRVTLGCPSKARRA